MKSNEIRRVLKAPITPVTDFASLQFPLLASDKEDGIRCIIHPVHGPCSQTMKPIPNEFVRDGLKEYSPQFLDGELVLLNSDGSCKSFNDVQSGIMTQIGYPEYEFRVFDSFANVYAPYVERMKDAKNSIEIYTGGGSPIKWLPQTWCYTVHDIEKAEENALSRGKEGLMLRSPRGWYKEGRSTLCEQYLLKVKRFCDDEAIVIGMEEQMENCNLATRDAGGLSKRSKHKANLKPKGRVGKLVCLWQGHEIRVDGFTDLQRDVWWASPSLIVGETITFSYQKHGMLNLPRTPKFKGIRYD